VPWADRPLRLVGVGLYDSGGLPHRLGRADRERKAKATIASGLRAGAAKPRRRRNGAP
jgi:hypothetical protein